MDKKKIEKAVAMLLEAVGENPAREGLKGTPRRMAELYGDILEGQTVDPKDILTVYYSEEEHEEIVLVKDIVFYSMCEHHLLPFFGTVHVAYIPKKHRLLGISKLVRVVEMYARRLQLQERMTKQMADAIMEVAKPHGCMVVIEAEHLCMTMRGVKKHGSQMVTSAMRGVFLKDARTRAEALALIKR